MWIAILITIALGGFLFYGLATFHLYIEHKDFSKPPPTPKPKAPSKLSKALGRLRRKFVKVCSLYRMMQNTLVFIVFFFLLLFPQ